MRDPEKLFADAIIGWHEACGRHDLPWQVEAEVSETCLGGDAAADAGRVGASQVRGLHDRLSDARVSGGCARRRRHGALGWASDTDSRARNLLKAVRIIVNEMGGRCPETAAELEKLSGTRPLDGGRRAPLSPSARGPSWRTGTHSACSRACSMVEGNAAQPRRFVKEIRTLAASLLPSSELMPTYTQALMDFGAMLCKRTVPTAGPVLWRTAAARVWRAGWPTFPGRKPRRERPSEACGDGVRVCRERPPAQAPHWRRASGTASGRRP